MKMKKLLLLFFIPALLVGCDTWLDVNKDPNNPQDVPITLLLPTVEYNATYALCAGGGTYAGLSQDLGVYTHQLSTREEANAYGVNGGEYYLGLAWDYMYVSALQNLDNMIVKAGKVDAPGYAGIGKIMKAYMYSQFVDVFGDIPFSEANMKSSGILYPKFDKGEDIYPQLITMLDEGIVDLGKTSAIAPGSDDLIYGGSSTKWIKAANTIKLKLYTQIRFKDNTVGPKIAALLASPATLMGATADGFMFPFTSKSSPDERNPAYSGTYEATQKTVNMSPWFYEILKGINPLFSGIVDPRIPYYFYNQMDATSATPKDGNPFEYRDGGFTSIYFGSDGPDNGHGQDKSQTVYGIYPCGGRYDQGDHLTVTGTSGTGAAPYRFLTYADKLFLEAELIQAGVITGDARAKLSAAMNEAFKLVDYVVTKANGSQTVPVLATSASATTYKNAILALYDAGNSDKQMEIIMTQKWISSFGSHVDQYTDYRRTGYPVIFDPNNTTMAPGGYVTPPTGGDPSRDTGSDPAVKVSCSLKFPRSLPWSTGELNVNKNAPAQKSDLSTPYVFWDPKL
jgi:hypothetical protein